jgi:hypothetical protein
MKFYTAEMVNRWNSDTLGANKELHDREWDAAQDQYDRHYARIADSLPASVRNFNETAVLHDETALSLPRELDVEGRVIGYKRDSEYTIVTLSRADRILHVLSYLLEKPPVVRVHDGQGFDPPDSSSIWLYDEFDVDDAGLFVHRVLFSNGVEMTFTFSNFYWYEAEVREEG